MRTLILGAAFAALLPTTLLAQRDDDDGVRQRDTTFRWEGTVPEGKWLILRNLNGAVRVEAASGNKVEVSGVKRWRRGNPDDVRITVEKFGAAKDNVIICALWSESAECDEDGYRSNRDGGDHWSNRRNDVSVDFTVKLPKGVKIETSSVNGSVRINGATSLVEATTVNGSVEAWSSAGPVRASTVNGDVDVHMKDPGTGDLDYATVNGSVTIELPPSLDAEIDMSTVNGSLRSDFPLTVNGRVSPRHMRATIGSGGRRIKVRTVNGSVELKKT